MTKRIEIDGKFYRKRRGKIIQIPDEWVGHIPTTQTIRQRPSKINGSLQRTVKDAGGVNRYKDRRDELRVSED